MTQTTLAFDRLVHLAAAIFLFLASIGVALRCVQTMVLPSKKSTSAMWEGETLRVLDQNRAFAVYGQSTEHFGAAEWTNHHHLFGEAGKKGDWVDLELPVSTAGHYEIYATLTKSRDFGIIQFSINGAKAGSPIDLWSGGVAIQRTGPISLGVFTLNSSAARVRIEVVGHHPQNQSPHFQFGLDNLWLEKK